MKVWGEGRGRIFLRLRFLSFAAPVRREGKGGGGEPTTGKGKEARRSVTIYLGERRVRERIEWNLAERAWFSRLCYRNRGPQAKKEGGKKEGEGKEGGKGRKSGANA